MLNKYLSIVISILLIGCMTWVIYLHRHPNLNLFSGSPIFCINDIDFCGEFGTDKKLGNNFLLGKAFKVSGAIMDLQEHDSTALLRLYDQETETFINCKFQTGGYKKLKMLPRRSLITIKGKFIGYNSEISLADCEIKQR
jgi:hypothetical protein